MNAFFKKNKPKPPFFDVKCVKKGSFLAIISPFFWISGLLHSLFYAKISLLVKYNKVLFLIMEATENKHIINMCSVFTSK